MKGIIFDMDGTMVDNMMVHHQAWQKKLAELGLEMSLEEVQEKIHGVNTEILEGLFGDRFTLKERRKIAWEKEAAYREIFFPELKLVDGLAEFLEEIRQAGIPMAVGSAAPGENVDFVLDNLNLRSYFKAVFHAGNVQKGKPDPEVYELAAAGMGVPLTDCLIFEDSVTGAETIRRAGCPAVIITTTHQEEEFKRFTHILRFIKDFREVRLEDFRG